MREQTVVMQSGQGSRVLEEIAGTAKAALFEGASFVLSLGAAYLAVCYGISVPPLKSIQKTNP